MNDIKGVFISYGRRESKAFAAKLHDHLVAEGKSVWFDQNDIPLGVDFQFQIDDGIEKADNFIFVIAPHSLKSPYCLKEILLALKRNKRIIPILHIEPSEKEVWDKMHPQIGKINWIYMREKYDPNLPVEEFEKIDDFDVAFQGLRQLLESQKDYVRQHTLLLQKALTWDSKQRQDKLLLTGGEFENAQDWLTTEFVQEQPPCSPSPLHAEFISESRKQQDNQLTDVFICYDDKHRQEVMGIRDELIKRGVTCWMDKSDIKSGAQFEESIQRGLENAANLLFFITPVSIESKYCLMEIDTFIKLNKRVIPLMFEYVPDRDIPAGLRFLQYIDFTDNIDPSEEMSKNEKSDFQKDLDNIIAELRKDQQHHWNHTRYLQAGLQWECNGRKASHLLDTYQIQPMRDWMQKAKGMPSAFGPLDIHEEYLSASEDRDAGKRIERHEYWLDRAQAWVDSGHDNGLLLQGAECSSAEAWLKDAEKNAPVKPTELHTTFIKTSRKKQPINDIRDVFISYSRRSLEFARHVHQSLVDEGFSVWFDQNNIPLGVDFQDEIDQGIEKAHNFIFIISPSSVRSSYCLKEVKLAVKRNKRIIPILYQELVTKTDWDAMHPTIGKLNWIYLRNRVDSYSKGFTSLISSLRRDTTYVHRHTELLSHAVFWEKNLRNSSYLLVDQERKDAESWLSQKFTQGQPPCIPSELHAEFIAESKQRANNDMTDTFICYHEDDYDEMRKVRLPLLYKGVTTWIDRYDVKSGMRLEEAIRDGIERADTFLLFLTPNSVKDEAILEQVKYADELNKPIVPLLMKPVPQK